jgi:putative hydrolase of the HAD superfamily
MSRLGETTAFSFFHRIEVLMSLSSPLPRVVFFDAVGTLLHPEPSAPAIYTAVGRRFGSQLTEDAIATRFREAFQRQDREDYRAGLRTSEEREFLRWRSIVHEIFDALVDWEACFHELYEYFAQAGAWRCEPGTAEVLDTLAARGHILGIASNFDRRLRNIVQHTPALRSVRYLVISSEIGWRKPAPDFFREVCRIAGSRSEELVYVGDDPVNDYGGARNARLRVLMLDPLKHAMVSPDERISTIKEILSI